VEIALTGRDGELEVGLAGTAVDFDTWVAARGPGLLRLAYTLTGNRSDAEDVVQEALARALPRWSRISRVENVDAYVRRMVINAHTSWWRRWKRRESPVAELRDSTVDAPGEAFDDRHRLWLACQALPEVQRTAVVLRYYEQLEYAEIADLTGVREGSVRSRVSRGLSALRESMGEGTGGTDE
jgi:RNA polymerase sigma-70 factor (sigma-E family)